jgi:hypothetical protein
MYTVQGLYTVYIFIHCRDERHYIRFMLSPPRNRGYICILSDPVLYPLGCLL